MFYTVKQLADMSGISSRTLRFYDQIGLLKPAYYGDNQYRYYQENQLLRLQQILFFKELGFSLDKIRGILDRDTFDTISLLIAHKKSLKENIKRTEKLIETITKTVSHLKGDIIMNDFEMYEGFDYEKQQEYEHYLVEKAGVSEEEIQKSWEKVRHLSKSDWNDFHQQSNIINEKLIDAINQGLSEDNSLVQAIIAKHYEWVNQFWTPNKSTYKGLAMMYQEHEDFRSHYESFHPKLLPYLIKAMHVYADACLVD